MIIKLIVNLHMIVPVMLSITINLRVSARALQDEQREQ